MLPRAARRLPGVQFESRPPRLPEPLPRMDVAAFIGFARSGPLDLPVVVEDAAAFADVFGDDAELAWDRERTEKVQAKLGPAVRAFFRNGGSRCWVVRVANRKDAASNHLAVPGLVRLRGSDLTPAFAAARSQGSWSDTLEVGAVALRAPAHGTLQGNAVVLDAPDTVAVGDLLQLTFDDGTRKLAPVENIDGRVATLRDQAVWLLKAPVGAGPWTASWESHARGQSEPMPALESDPVFGDDESTSLRFLGVTDVAPGHLVLLRRGLDQVWVLVTDVSAITIDGSPPGRGTLIKGTWSYVSTTAPSIPSPLHVCERVRVELWVREHGGNPRRLADLGLSPGHPRYLGALPTDAQLFAPDEDLLSPDEDALRQLLRDRFGDATSLRAYHADLWQAVANPRFPLAMDEGRTDVFLPLGMPILPDAYLGLEPVTAEPAVRDGLAAFDAALFIDNLSTDLGAPIPVDTSTQSLAALADFIRWQSPAPRRLRGMHAVWELEEPSLIAAPDAIQRGWAAEVVDPPQALATPVLTATPDAQGLWHLTWNSVAIDAQYVLEQAENQDFSNPTLHRFPAGTLGYDVGKAPPPLLWFRVRAFRPRVAHPDYFEIADDEAAGSFWSDPVEVITPPPQFDDCPSDALGAPTLSLDAPPDGTGTYRLSWTEVPGALRYRVEESEEIDFASPRVVFQGSARDVTIYGRAPGRYRYRVRAEGVALGIGVVVLSGDSAAIVDVIVDGVPRHLLVASYGGDVRDETVFDGDLFSERFVAGSGRVVTAAGFRYNLLRDDPFPGAPSFRAFELGAIGPWSHGLTVPVPPPSRRVLAPVRGYLPGALLAVQAQLVRLAATRGDLLAVLSLPEHYRENDAVHHVTLLRDLLPEDATWSYGALYHPWLIAEGDTDLVRVPPEGAATGMIAARANARGAWIAPANEPLADVVGLSPPIAREQRQRLYEAQVNLVTQEPHGFVVMAADTLASDPELFPINVRRLLSLLRRIAMRLGPTFTFEPNTAMFRRSVEREFEAMLGTMYRAGAFAGRRPDDSFQVAVDASINTDASIDQGRFIVELKVAPSQPLSFLTVRLVQDGVRSRVTES